MKFERGMNVRYRVSGDKGQVFEFCGYSDVCPSRCYIIGMMFNEPHMCAASACTLEPVDLADKYK